MELMYLVRCGHHLLRPRPLCLWLAGGWHTSRFFNFSLSLGFFGAFFFLVFFALFLRFFVGGVGAGLGALVLPRFQGPDGVLEQRPRWHR